MELIKDIKNLDEKTLKEKINKIEKYREGKLRRDY